MRRTYIIIAAMALLTAGCQKENTINGMKLVAEDFRNDRKVAVENNICYWVGGESVNINGEVKTVQINDGSAYLNQVGRASNGVYRAIYPASLVSNFAGEERIDITFPSSYQWAADDNGRQILGVPMAAYSSTTSDTRQLMFKHLTAAITVEITNYYGFPVVVDNVTVTSDRYQLCGTQEFYFPSIEGNLIAPTENNQQSSVQMTFNDNDQLIISQGQTKRVQMPVLPVGSDNRFTIVVTVHKEGDAAVTKTYTRTQGNSQSDYSLSRAQMAYAGDIVGFPFSVHASQKVIISMGNLKCSRPGTGTAWDQSTLTWSFMDHQYDIVETNGNVGDNYENETTVSLFGWGTSGYHGSSRTSVIAYQPYTTDQENNHYIAYLSGGTSLFDGDKTADWGYNAISNGGNIEHYGWRTMTGAEDNIGEWNYLLWGRGVDWSFAPAIINEKYGIIVFPDNYTHPSSLSNRMPTYLNSYPNSATPTTYTTDEWALMEAEGAIFLPEGGYRYGRSVSDVSSYAYYWTSTRGDDDNNAYQFRFNNWGYAISAYNSHRSTGMAVRLVMDVPSH